MLILKRAEIEQRVNFELAFDAIEQAYIATSLGQVNLPPVGHITFPDADADCHIKYGHLENDPVFVVKIATGFPCNGKMGLPTGNGLSIVMSAEDGSVKALLHDEMWLTDVRTGIGGAIASHALARPNVKTILVVGTGTQAKHQIEAHAHRFDQSLHFVVWGRSVEKATSLTEELSRRYNVTTATDLRTACGKADVIVTTTGSTEPMIKADWVRQGTHITAIGADAPGKQELDTKLMSRADILVADSIEQCLDHGELEAASKAGSLEADQIFELGKLLADRNTIKRSDADISIADLTGIAAQDIAIAKVVLGDKISSV